MPRIGSPAEGKDGMEGWVGWTERSGGAKPPFGMAEKCGLFCRCLIIRDVQDNVHFESAFEMLRIALVFSSRLKRVCYKMDCISRPPRKTCELHGLFPAT